MDFGDRLSWWLFGCAIGFVLGYVVRSIQDIREKVDDMDKRLKKDDGYVLSSTALNIILGFVVIVTFIAAISSQISSNRIQNTSERADRVTACNQQYLIKITRALNERTTFAQQQSEANVQLHKTEAEVFNTILNDPTNDKLEAEQLRKYIALVGEFVKTSAKSSEKVRQFPYPKAGDLQICYNEAVD